MISSKPKQCTYQNAVSVEIDGVIVKVHFKLHDVTDGTRSGHHLWPARSTEHSSQQKQKFNIENHQ